MSRSSTLYRLQRVDSQLDARQAQLAVLNARLASSPAVQKAQADLAAAQARVAEARGKAKTLEQDSQGLAEKIREVEEQLYGGKVTNPRELIDFQAEAESLQRNRSGADDKQLAAIEAAHAREMVVVGLTGRGGGKMAQVLRDTDVHICVPHERTARIQEVHLLALHCICDAVDAQLLGDQETIT